jgi:OPA family sugar phosphate sensor protein UhpC-like MFS transporter
MGQADSLALTQGDMAWIDGGFLAAYALGQFVWGMMGDRFGTRRVVLVGMLGSIGTAIAMGLAAPEMLPDWMVRAIQAVVNPIGVTVVTFLLGSLFFAQGLFQSSGWAPLAKNMAQFFSTRERGMVFGLWCTNYAAGGLIASLFAGYVGQAFGWRAAFLVPAITLFGIWLLFYLLQRDRPEDVGLPPIEVYHPGEPGEAAADKVVTPERTGRWAVILEVLSNPVVLLLCAVYFCLKPARYAILFWGPKYLYDKLGTGMAESGLLSALFEAAGPLSVFLAGLASDKLFGSRRMPVSILCLGCLSVVLFVLDKLPQNAWLLGGCLFLIGLLTYAPDSLISGTAAIDFGSKRGASTASGLINGFGSIGAIVGGTLPGFFQEKGGWQAVFTLLAIAVLLAAILLLPKWNALPPRK